MQFHFDFSRMEELLKHFGAISSFRCSLTDNIGRVYCASREISSFCAYVQHTEQGYNRCQRCNAEVIARAARSQTKFLVCRCHAGILKAVVPIRQDDETLAYLLMGQVIGEGDRDKLWKQTASLLSWMDDTDTLHDLFFDLPQVSTAELESSARILEACAASVWMDAQLRGSVVSETLQLAQYINDHYTEPLTLTSIARALSMSKTKLCSIAAAQDTTVMAMVNGKRIDEACRLLRHRGCSVGDAADRVGVADHNYFSKLFRTYMGETPREYQKRHLHQEIIQP